MLRTPPAVNLYCMEVTRELQQIFKLDFKTNSFCSRAHYNYLISRGIENRNNIRKLRFHKGMILKLTKVKYKNEKSKQ